MTKISIIKKIPLGGKKSFPIETPDFKLPFSFYCGNGAIKHEAIISFKNSSFLNSLIETGQITNKDLAQFHITKLENLEDPNRTFLYRYQICNFKDCHNTYLLIFDIDEYRDYYSCFIHAVLQVEK
ncbi:hypothetical protein [Flavobacterium sp. LHD-85]|uniref:hypothetical protein n=1 Tax=Flavobacterium sp. LHD-85 TaxID=3071410 RepID=UPI0027E04BF3|nr:hypothetical protein [Flavobacterium sp. LHD-85]MDQ6529245.1 hypothetical protein [Flavobacterium sp. LHD-85]